MPPAPTMPSTPAARMLISKRYSQKATISGRTWGMTPQRCTGKPAAAHRPRGLHGSGVDRLDGLGGELAERADGVDADGQGAGRGSEADDGDEHDEREDELRERPGWRRGSGARWSRGCRLTRCEPPGSPSARTAARRSAFPARRWRPSRSWPRWRRSGTTSPAAGTSDRRSGPGRTAVRAGGPSGCRRSGPRSGRPRRPR